MDDRGISVKYRWDIWAYLGFLLKAVHQGQPSFAELLSQAAVAAVTLHLNKPGKTKSATKISQRDS